MAQAVRSTRPEDNLGLVYKVAHRFMRSALLPVDWEFDDLASIGTTGLMKASARFDPGRGFEFSTYAIPLIEGEVRRALRDTVPAGYRRRPEYPPETLSLDAPLDEDGDRDWGDMLADPNAVDPQEAGDLSDVRAAMDLLPDDTGAVVRMYFFDGLREAEIGGRLGTTQATVSRRLSAGLRSLRSILEAQERGDADMGKHGGWNALPIDADAVRRWTAEGLDREEIAGRLRITVQQLRGWCYNHGMPVPRKAGEAQGYFEIIPPTEGAEGKVETVASIPDGSEETQVAPSAPEIPAEMSREEWTSSPTAITQEQYAPAARIVAEAARNIRQESALRNVVPSGESPFRTREREGGIVLPIRVEGARVIVGDIEVEGDITDVEVAVAAREIRERLAALLGEGGAA